MQHCLTGAHDGGPTTNGLIANTFDVKTGDLNSLQSSLKGHAELVSLHLASKHAMLIKLMLLKLCIESAAHQAALACQLMVLIWEE